MSQLVEYTVPEWRGLNMRALRVDEAYVWLKSYYSQVSYLYSLSEECYTCPYSKLKALRSTADVSIETKPADHEVIKLNIAAALSFRVYANDVGPYALENKTALCDLEGLVLDEFGVYNFTLHQNGTCELSTDKEGVNVNLPILSVFVLFTLILLALKISYCVWNSYRFEPVSGASAATEANESTETIGTVVVPQQRKRLKSLDTFRGLAIVLMIFVNSGGGGYRWIEHAHWNGLHLADIVFPFFLWIMGVCIPISVKSQLSHGMTKGKICWRIIWRSFKLFAIGLCLNSVNGPPLEQLRIMGVLQRFGIAFLVCGLVHTLFASRVEAIMPQAGWKRAIYEIILLRGELLVMLALIATHLGIIFGLNVPNCPKGYLGPGGKHAYAAHFNCTAGATRFIDMQIIGPNHIYKWGTAVRIYDALPFDPEGVFGSLLSIVQVLLGIVAGNIILTRSDWTARIIRWLTWSVFLGLIGGVLCDFTREEGLIPINKNLWSLSFVLITASLAFLLLSILYFIVDVLNVWKGSPFLEAGKNAIILYVGHTVMHKMLPWHWRYGAMNTHFVLLLEAVWNTLLWIAIALYMDYKKFYYSL